MMDTYGTHKLMIGTKLIIQRNNNNVFTVVNLLKIMFGKVIINDKGILEGIDYNITKSIYTCEEN